MSNMVDAFVRQIFQEGLKESVPIATASTISTATNGFYSLEIRPPAGTVWSLNYAVETLVSGTTSLGSAQIDYYTGSAWITIASHPSTVWRNGDSLSVASFGNGPIILTRERYLRIGFTVASSQDCVVHLIALTENR